MRNPFRYFNSLRRRSFLTLRSSAPNGSSIRIEHRLAGRATMLPPAPWRIHGSPHIRLEKCYFKSLKYHTEKVRPQLLSLRQYCICGQSLCLLVGPEKPGIRPFFEDGCAPWTGAGGPELPSNAVHLVHSVPASLLRRNQELSRPLTNIQFANHFGWPRYRLETIGVAFQQI
jgi:hypothetical protein